MNLIIILSNYFSARADRVCKMMSGNLSMFFAFKCLLKKYPYYMLLIIIIGLTTTLAQILHIVEGPVYNSNNGEFKNLNSYQNYSDCLWNVFAIITTVGYGDYYPKSNLGRFTVIITSFIGILLVSLIIITCRNKIKFDSNENDSKIFVDRMKNKSIIESEASNYFKYTLRFLVTKSSFMRNMNLKDNKRISKLKANVEKSMKNRIKQRVLLRGLIREFNRDFHPYDPSEYLKSKLKDLSNKSNILLKESHIIKNNLDFILNKLQ